MSDEKDIETRTIRVKGKDGKTYRFKAIVRGGYSYCDERKTRVFVVFHEKASLLHMTALKENDTDEYQVPPTSGWSYVLEGLVPEDKDIGARLWKRIEALFYKYRVTCVHGIIGQPPGMSECLGHGPSESDRAKNRKAAHFWAKVGFTVNGSDIRKEYPPRAT